MNQKQLDQDEHKKMKADGSYEKTFEMLNSTFAGCVGRVDWQRCDKS